MTARNHHYIPQCYLKGFVAHRNKPKLFVIDLKRRKAFESHPRNVAAERDFHAINVDGQPSDVLEQTFSQFEGQLALALGHTIAAKAIKNENDQLYILNLVSLIAAKNPRVREQMRDFQERIAEIVIQMITSDERIYASQILKAKEAGFIKKDADVTREQLREFVQRGEYSFDVDTGFHLAQELTVNDKLLPCLVGRHWTLLRAPSRSPGFITADHPVCLSWSDPEYMEPRHPPGFGMTNTEVFFPIASGFAWLGTFEHQARVHDVDDNVISLLNASVISNLDQQVYGKSGDCFYRFRSNEKPRRLRELLNDHRFTDHKPTKDLNAAQKRRRRGR